MTTTGGVPLNWDSDLMRSIITKGRQVEEPNKDDEPTQQPTTHKSNSPKPILGKAGDWERLSDVKPTNTEWLVPQLVPSGTVSVFAGDGGVGKTLMALDIAARGSTGRDFGNGAKNEGGIFETILLSGEDDPSSILVPRLLAAQADLSKIHRVTSVQILQDGAGTGERGIDLESDLDLIRQRIEEHPAIRLCILDPLANFLGGLDMNREQEVRQALMPCVKLSQELGVAFLIISHHSKQMGRTAANKVLGAVGVMGAARIGWTFMKSETDSCRLMLQSKFNLGRFPGIRYDTEEVEVLIDGKATKQARIRFLGNSDAEAETVIAQAEDLAGRIEKPAVKIIRAMMPPSSDHETEVHSDPIIKAGIEAGVSESTMKRARKGLRIKTARVCNQWLWRWMDEDEKDE